jgi:hypothetical protein
VVDDTAKELDKETVSILNIAEVGITPILGHCYHLYKRKDGTYFISLIGPEEWNKEKQPGAFEKFIISLESTGDNKWLTT